MMNWRQSVGVIALLVTTLAVPSAWAEQQDGSPQRTWLRQPPPRSTSAPVRGELTLGRWSAIALLVGLASFALWKGAKRRKLLPAITSSAIQVGSVVKVTPKAHLAIVTVNGRSMLLGATDAAVTRLMWLDEVATEDEGNEDTEPPLGIGLGVDASNTVTNAGQASIGQRAELKPRRTATLAAGAGTGNVTVGSKFRDILSDVIGIESRTKPNAGKGPSPAEVLAATTVDRFRPRNAQHEALPGIARSIGKPPMIDCEGQAAGLIARLNRTHP